MTWALRRQIIFIAILTAILALLGFLIIYPKLNKLPNCNDGVQNGSEEGIDCGGSCARACMFQVDQISVLWSRVFKVIPGRYNAVAYVENHNRDTAVYKIKYRFRFSDKDNIYIGKREGETFIPAGGKYAVFEPAVDVGNSIPVYTTFEFTEAPVWSKVPEDKLNKARVLVSNVKLEMEDTTPRLSATIKNNSFYTIPDVNVVALLYDEKGNVVSASRTYLKELKWEEVRDINFTWPTPILDKVILKEIIPMYNIFAVKLK